MVYTGLGLWTVLMNSLLPLSGSGTLLQPLNLSMSYFHISKTGLGEKYKHKLACEGQCQREKSL
jgi:hypothetical protein